MSVTSATYTTNSIQITVSNETTPVNIMSSVNTAITSLGWTQYDYMAAGDTTPYDYYNGKVIPSATVSANADSIGNESKRVRKARQRAIRSPASSFHIYQKYCFKLYFNVAAVVTLQLR